MDLPDGKMCVTILTRHLDVCHNLDTSSGHRKSILTKNEYTSLAKCKIHTKPTMMIFVMRQLLKTLVERIRVILVASKIYYGVLVSFGMNVKRKS